MESESESERKMDIYLADDRAISSTWLAYHSNIPSIEATKRIEDYAKDHIGKVMITYVVCGKMKGTQESCIKLVSDADLEQVIETSFEPEDLIIKAYAIQNTNHERNSIKQQKLWNEVYTQRRDLVLKKSPVFLKNQFSPVMTSSSSMKTILVVEEKGAPNLQRNEPVGLAPLPITESKLVVEPTSHASKSSSTPPRTGQIPKKSADFFTTNQQPTASMNENREKEESSSNSTKVPTKESDKSKQSFFQPKSKLNSTTTTTQVSSNIPTKAKVVVTKGTITSLFANAKPPLSPPPHQQEKQESIPEQQTIKEDEKEEEKSAILKPNQSIRVTDSDLEEEKEEQKLTKVAHIPVTRSGNNTQPKTALDHINSDEEESEVEFGESPVKRRNKRKFITTAVTKRNVIGSDGDDDDDDDEEEEELDFPINHSKAHSKDEKEFDEEDVPKIKKVKKSPEEETEAERATREYKEQLKREKAEKRKLEKLEEKALMERVRIERENEEKEMAKKKFVSQLGGGELLEPHQQDPVSNEPVRMKRVLITQTKVDDEGYEITEDVWVSVPMEENEIVVENSKATSSSSTLNSKQPVKKNNEKVQSKSIASFFTVAKPK